MTKHEQAISILMKAKADLKTLLDDDIDQHQALRIDSGLQKILNTFSLTTGNGGFQGEIAHEPGPATTIMGETLVKDTITKAESLKPDPDLVAELKDKIEVAFKTFPTMSSAEILQNVEDTVIRGVAKKAGLKGVSKDHPKETTVDFINSIKYNITKFQEKK